MIAEGGCDSKIEDNNAAEDTVREGMECDASAMSAIMNSDKEEVSKANQAPNKDPHLSHRLIVEGHLIPGIEDLPNEEFQCQMLRYGLVIQG